MQESTVMDTGNTVTGDLSIESLILDTLDTGIMVTGGSHNVYFTANITHC